MPTKDEMLDTLWSKEAIRDLALRYCRACDRNDMTMLESVFHSDALDEHGFNKTRTAREFIDACSSMRSRMLELQHNVTIISSRPWRRGGGEVYVLVYHHYVGEDGRPCCSWAGAISTNTRGATANGKSRTGSAPTSGALLRPRSSASSTNSPRAHCRAAARGGGCLVQLPAATRQERRGEAIRGSYVGSR